MAELLRGGSGVGGGDGRGEGGPPPVCCFELTPGCLRAPGLLRRNPRVCAEICLVKSKMGCELRASSLPARGRREPGYLEGPSGSGAASKASDDVPTAPSE